MFSEITFVFFFSPAVRLLNAHHWRCPFWSRRKIYFFFPTSEKPERQKTEKTKNGEKGYTWRPTKPGDGVVHVITAEG